MDIAIRDFFLALDRQESKFFDVLKADNLGLLIRSAITEFDWFGYNFSRRTDHTFDEIEQNYILRIGAIRLIQIALEVRSSFVAPAFMYVRNEQNSTTVLKIMSALGIIQHGRRIAQTAMSNYCKITQLQENHFQITLPEKLPDPEHYERKISEHYAAHYQNTLKQALALNNIQAIEKEVEESLQELVFPFLGKWIGYNSNLLLDEYFFSMAHSKMQIADGIDTFHYSACFGGVPYLHYTLALTFIVSLHEKHQRFAETLATKDDNIKLENILTITGESLQFIKSIVEAVNHFGTIYKDFTPLNLPDAKKIFDILSISRLSPKELWQPGCCTPLLIQTSENSFTRCLSSTADYPVQFMLNSLRLNYPKDYDNHQRKREKPMCNAIKSALLLIYNNLEFRENINIRINKKILTDIDLTIYEASTSTVFLCQLKHQELYGSDLHAKHTRSNRLKQQATKWLEAVNSWTNAVGDNGIRSALNIKSSKSGLTIYRVFITRHYAHPLSDLELNNDTVFGNYLQFLNSAHLIKKNEISNPKLSDLITLLKTSQSPWGPAHHIDQPESDWIIGELKFSITSSRETPY